MHDVLNSKGFIAFAPQIMQYPQCTPHANQEKTAGVRVRPSGARVEYYTNGSYCDKVDAQVQEAKRLQENSRPKSKKDANTQESGFEICSKCRRVLIVNLDVVVCTLLSILVRKF